MHIIITLEQFPIFFAGAYGNKTNQTPGLNALTLKSTVFDRAYSTCADGLETLFQLWESCDFSEESQYFSGKRIFLSDLPVDAPDFFDVGRLVTAEDFFADAEAILAQTGWQPETDGIAWIHFQICPLEALDAWLTACRTDHPTIFDSILALLATSGELPTSDVRLYSSEVQLPWWIRFPDSCYSGTRSSALVTAMDFQRILDAGTPEAQFRNGIRIQTENERWAVVTPTWFLTGFETEGQDGQDDNNDRSDYDCTSGNEPELYFKPADWWDQNDVAVRCYNEIQDLIRFRNGLIDAP